MRFTFCAIFSAVVLFSFSCTKEPEYPLAPTIEFDKVERFKIFDSFTQTYTDSVNITIRFSDGDGDLGLSDSDIINPYQPYTIQYDRNKVPVLFGSSDTLPAFDDCNYIVSDLVESNPGVDTVRVKPNEDYYNYFTELWVKEGNTFEKVDLTGICPAPFNGRFPVLSPNDYSGPIDGYLSFSIQDPGLRFLVEGKTAKFRVFIKDRALHKSNIIETSELTFTY